MIIKSGDEVTVSLTLLSVDGEVIPTGSGDQTITKNVIVDKLYKNTLDQFVATEVKGKDKNIKKTYNLSGDLFFQPHRQDLICNIPMSNVDKDLKEGELIKNSNGQVACILSTKENDYVVADFNHPFSGKMLEVFFEVKNIKSCFDSVMSNTIN